MQARWHGGDQDRALVAALSTGLEEALPQPDAGLLSQRCREAAGADEGYGPCPEAGDGALEGDAAAEDWVEEEEEQGEAEGEEDQEAEWEEGPEDEQGQEGLQVDIDEEDVHDEDLGGAGEWADTEEEEEEEEEVAQEAELGGGEGGAGEEVVDVQNRDEQPLLPPPVLGAEQVARGPGASPLAVPPVEDAAAPGLAPSPLSAAGQPARRRPLQGAPTPGPQQGGARPPARAASREYVRGRGRGAPVGGPRAVGQVTPLATPGRSS